MGRGICVTEEFRIRHFFLAGSKTALHMGTSAQKDLASEGI